MRFFTGVINASLHASYMHVLICYVMVCYSHKKHKMVIVMDETKLNEVELKVETRGMLLNYEEEEYDCY